MVNFRDTTFALYANHPDPESIDWKFCSKEDYLEIENIFTKNVKFFDPFVIENFFEEEDFNELRDLLTSTPLDKIIYTKQMNKWEDAVPIPNKFFEKALDKIKKVLGTDDVELGYYLYAHHQITSEGRKPFLQIHLDWSPGSYMIDLHIGGNRDWGFVAHDKEFITKPNDAVIVQPEFDFHYRPDWASDNTEEYYQVLFFHLVRKDHWKNIFGIDYMKDEKFLAFQHQRLHIWQPLYVKFIKTLPHLPSPLFGDDRDLTEDDKSLLGVQTKEKTE
jgi:hypothetical protein